MKFGTFHLFQKPPGWSNRDVFDCECEQIERSDALSLDGVWLAEHHFQWYGHRHRPHTGAKRIGWMRTELGVNYPMSSTNIGGPPQAKVLRPMQFFAEEVIPRFHTGGATANG